MSSDLPPPEDDPSHRAGKSRKSALERFIVSPIERFTRPHARDEEKERLEA